MDIRYQVFVSSTYSDLIEERQKVIQALMSMDCIPSGMELFPAMDEDQFKFITRIIDDCDYYILILGGRYGSISDENISFTEMEYDYAIERKLKVLAFAHQDPDQIPMGKSESDAARKVKLEKFRTKVLTNRLVKFWNNPDQLSGLVALSLQQTMKIYPAVGWVRANSIPSDDIYRELVNAKKENEQLRSEIAKNQVFNIPNLAPIESTIDVGFTLIDSQFNGTRRKEKITFSWQDLFTAISPDLQDRPTDQIFKERIDEMLLSRSATSKAFRYWIDQEDFKTIRIQLTALDLVKIETATAADGKNTILWCLTKNGEQMMMHLRTLKTAEQTR